ncbi:MAG: response regulator, partial [Muribaculaceae bacterium]|nr:response regulator [Muribaculaceae bacterium]
TDAPAHVSEAETGADSARNEKVDVQDDEIPITSEHPKHRGVKPTLLVAEDNESNYFLMSSLLEDDYNLIHAWNGREAVELFSEKHPDLILMDINMPLMDGYEATRNIRQLSGTVPVIAVTAYAFSSDRTRIMESGFDSYVSKPVNADRLLGEIARLLG